MQQDITESPKVGLGFALALNPTTADQAMKCAEWMAKSDLVPKAYHNKPHDIVIAAAMGARLGLDPFSALAGIAVINGRPCLWGDAMLAVCQHRSDWDGMRVEWSGETANDLTCTVTIGRKGSTPYTGSFSVEEAKKASLWGKAGPWSNYPRRMLELRARSYALRGAFADALAGFIAREEAEDIKEAEATVVAEPVPMRRRITKAARETEQTDAPQEQAGDPTPEPPPVHPAITSARDLYKHHCTMSDKTGALAVARRLAAAYGADSIDKIEPARLDSLLTDVSRLAEMATMEEVGDALAEIEAAAAAFGGDK